MKVLLRFHMVNMLETLLVQTQSAWVTGCQQISHHLFVSAMLTTRSCTHRCEIAVSGSLRHAGVVYMLH